MEIHRNKKLKICNTKQDNLFILRETCHHRLFGTTSVSPQQIGSAEDASHVSLSVRSFPVSSNITGSKWDWFFFLSLLFFICEATRGQIVITSPPSAGEADALPVCVFAYLEKRSCSCYLDFISWSWNKAGILLRKYPVCWGNAAGAQSERKVPVLQRAADSLLGSDTLGLLYFDKLLQTLCRCYWRRTSADLLTFWNPTEWIHLWWNCRGAHSPWPWTTSYYISYFFPRCWLEEYIFRLASLKAPFSKASVSPYAEKWSRVLLFISHSFTSVATFTEW